MGQCPHICMQERRQGSSTVSPPRSICPLIANSCTWNLNRSGCGKTVGGYKRWIIGQGQCQIIILGQEAQFIDFRAWPHFGLSSAKINSPQGANGRGMSYFLWIKFNSQTRPYDSQVRIWFQIIPQVLRRPLLLLFCLSSLLLCEWALVSSGLTSVLVQTGKLSRTTGISEQYMR